MIDDDEVVENECNHQNCVVLCVCERDSYRSCNYRSCYECFLDRRADYLECIYCGRWHSPKFDTCWRCRPATMGRDDPAKALRQLILHRDQYRCRQCGVRAGELQDDPRKPDELIPAVLHADHIVPCKVGGNAEEWNLQILCSLHNYAKGSIWFPGCRFDEAKTRLVRSYFLIHRAYFSDEVRARFLAEVALWRRTRTWDPKTHKLEAAVS